MARRKLPTKPDPDATWLTVPEACWVLRKSVSWLYLRLNPDHPEHIESKVVGRSRLFSRAALDEYVDQRTASKVAA